MSSYVVMAGASQGKIGLQDLFNDLINRIVKSKNFVKVLLTF